MDDGDDMDVSQDGVTSKRACDLCRSRKIKCDRCVPCSNCKASRLSCKTTAPAQKAQRQRVHISEEYEKKIDRIEDRLTGIESVLANLATKLGNLAMEKDDVSSPSRSSQMRASNRNEEAMAETIIPAPFEGETTITSQSEYAREVLAQAIGKTPSIEQNAEIRTTLSALKDLVSQQNQPISSIIPISRSFAHHSPSELELPPLLAIRDALDKACKYPTMAFALIIPVLKLKNLKEIVDEAYFNPGTCSAPRRILAYGVMEKIFTEFKAFPFVNQDTTNFGAYSTMCQRHLEVAMSQLDIFMSASYENIVALLIGAAYFIESCKPSLSWIMISAAAGLCQNLGYHRINTMTNDGAEDRNAKIQIFWTTYMLDKLISLRLGRASIIQDWEISLPFVNTNEQRIDSPNSGRPLTYWINVARVQGQTYEKLFSPAAYLQSAEERARIANKLISSLNQAWFERVDTVMEFTGQGEEIRFIPQRSTSTIRSPDMTDVPSKRKRPELLRPVIAPLEAREFTTSSFERLQDVFFHCDVVGHYSTCALIQRAISPDDVTFNQECLKSSRAALAAHMRASAQFNTDDSQGLWFAYINWSILNLPFTPFIVIFCHVIHQNEPSDLSSLFEFVASLESCRTLSEGTDKLYQVCHMFSQIAKLYIQAKTQDSATSQAQVASQDNLSNYRTASGARLNLNAMNSFDPYLSALGLMPDWTWPVAGETSYEQAQGTVGSNLYTSTYGQGAGDPQGVDTATMGFGPPGGIHNSVQDWFSGSRYLMNVMEGANDLQMADLDL